MSLFKKDNPGFYMSINGLDPGDLWTKRESDPGGGYIGWTPVRCTISLNQVARFRMSGGDMMVELEFNENSSGGDLHFFKKKPTRNMRSEGLDSVKLKVSQNGHAEFYVAGKFPTAGEFKSDPAKGGEGDFFKDKKGTYITVKQNTNTPVKNLFGIVPIMVRVRKNANDLTERERKRFLEAFRSITVPNDRIRRRYTDTGPNGMRLVKRPQSIFDELVVMHTVDAAYEIHNRASFHPWHRMFLLHLERELQEKDPSVCLPYWRFHEKAEKVFIPDFIGVPSKTNMVSEIVQKRKGDENSGESIPMVTFAGAKNGAANHPLHNYVDATFWGPLLREYSGNFDPVKTGIWNENNASNAEEKVVQGKDYKKWSKDAENNPHDPAHGHFKGRVTDIGQDPVDPLFFLIHTNVDRLWALWQNEDNNRFNPNSSVAYKPQGTAPIDAKTLRNPLHKSVRERDYMQEAYGNYAKDGMWPWYHENANSRPNRESIRRVGDVELFDRDFPALSIPAPSGKGNNRTFDEPKVKDAIDYQGRFGEAPAGVDYADVPFFEADKKHTSKESGAFLKSNQSNTSENFFATSTDQKSRKALADQLVELPEKYLKKALTLMSDAAEDSEVRERIMSLVSDQDESFLKQVFNIAFSSKEGVKLRASAIHSLRTSKRSSRFFPLIRSQFLGGLKKLMNNEDAANYLRVMAMEILSTYEDEQLEEALVKLLENRLSLPISKLDALLLLGSYSKRNTLVDLFKRIIASDEEPSIRAQAILGLIHTPSEEEYLKELMVDELRPFSLRRAAAIAIESFNPQIVHDYALTRFEQLGREQGLLAANEAANDGSIDFNATLMNALCYTADHEALNHEGRLLSILTSLSSNDANQGLAPDRKELNGNYQATHLMANQIIQKLETQSQ